MEYIKDKTAVEELIADKRSIQYDFILKMYEILSEEEKYYLKRFFENLKFYWGIISLLFSGFIIGIYKFSKIYELIALMIIPLILTIITTYFKELTKREYRRFIESIIQKAKIEALLELDRLHLPESSSYWEGEDFIHSRYLNDRSSYKTSEDFQNYIINEKGALSIYKKFFNVVYFLCGVSILYLIFLISYEIFIENSISF